MALKKIATVDQIWSGEKVGVQVDGLRILLINIENSFYAYEDRCAHQAVPLSLGHLDGSVLTCAAHSWEFDVLTGKSVNPKGAQLKQYPVEVHGNDVFIDVTEAFMEKI